jgi:hypothetical protein
MAGIKRFPERYFISHFIQAPVLFCWFVAAVFVNKTVQSCPTRCSCSKQTRARAHDLLSPRQSQAAMCPTGETHKLLLEKF